MSVVQFCMSSTVIDLANLGRKVVLGTATVVVLLTVVNLGCGPSEKKRPVATKSGPKWKCKYDPTYLHKYTDAICAWTDENPGRPTTYTKCQELAGMLREMSRVEHNCDATNYTCIGVVASELGLEQMPDCSKLPGRPEEMDTDGSVLESGSMSSSTSNSVVGQGVHKAHKRVHKSDRSAGNAAPRCKKGKPCGNSCIAMNKTCHK